MSAIRDLRRSSGAMRCLECGKCSTLCPLSALRNFSAMRMATIHETAAEYATTVNRCLTCGSCEVRCPQGVRFTELVRGLRVELPRNPVPHGGVFQSAARAGIGRTLAWLDDDLRVAESGELALFVGCAPLFDALFADDLGVRTLDVTRAAIRLLNAAGIAPVLVEGELCCGHDLLWDGDEETFRALAIANAKAFEAKGVKHILTACAECARTWKVDYADAVPGYRPKVEHIAEWLARAELKFASSETVTFQDPCRLARHLGVVDAPRAVLSATGAQLVEMPKHGVDAQCCGTSGFVRCDADSRALQERRLDEAAATGAERLLTACPKCRIHFACTQKEDQLRGRKRARVKIEDIATFAERTLSAPSPRGRGEGGRRPDEGTPLTPASRTLSPQAGRGEMDKEAS